MIEGIVSDESEIRGNAIVRGSVSGNSNISDNAIVSVSGSVSGNSNISGNAIVNGKVRGASTIEGNVIIETNGNLNNACFFKTEKIDFAVSFTTATGSVTVLTTAPTLSLKNPIFIFYTA